MKSILCTLLATFIFIPVASYAYETEDEISTLYESKQYTNLQHLIKSTYSAYYIAKGSVFSWHGIAVGNNQLLTAAHNLASWKNHNLEIKSIIDKDDPKVNEILKIEYPLNNSDLALITLKDPLPEFIDKSEIEDRNQLLASNQTIFAIGYNKSYSGEGYAQKLSGNDNFYIGLLPDVFTTNSIELVASLANSDKNNNQINAVSGDSGGPWFSCNEIEQKCKLIAIQSWRGDFHKDSKFSLYRSVAVPVDTFSKFFQIL